MYTKLSKVMFPILAISLVIVCMWGYSTYQHKKQLVITVENQYQRSFHELTTNIEKLNHELGHTIVLHPTQSQSYRKNLAKASLFAQIAKNNISHLPLGIMPIQETDQFLANIASLTAHVSIREHAKNPEQATEWNTMQQLYAHSRDISQQLRTIQQHILQDKVSWFEMQPQLATSKSSTDHRLLDGMTKMNDGIGRIDPIDWGTCQTNAVRKKDMTRLTGQDVRPEQIKEKTIQFLELNQESKIDVEESAADIHGYASYDVKVRSSSNDHLDSYLNYSKKGGALMYYIANRPVAETKLTARQARDISNEFLDKHGFHQMTAVQYDAQQHIANITFVERKQDTLICPQQISVQVALDNGDILAMNATPYQFAKKDRHVSPMKLSVQEASQQLSPQFQVSNSTQAIIMNDQQEEVACYEFTGNMNGNTYRVCINGHTGIAEKIETLQERNKG